MPELPSRIDGELIEAAHMNDAQDRSVQRYDSETQRDTLNPAPTDGQMAWIADIDKLQTWNGSTWITYANPGILEADHNPPVDATISGALNADQAITSLTIPTSGTWIVWADGYINYSVGPARPTWTMRTTVGVNVRELTVTKAGSDAGDMTFAFHSTTAYNGGESLVLNVARDDVAGTQLAKRFKLTALRIG